MSYTKTFAFAVPGMAFDGETYKHKSLGGSETAGLFMAKSLSNQGHTVYVFSNTEEYHKVDGVYYIPIDQWKKFSYTTPHDVSVVQRLPSLFATNTQAKLNILWAHDLAQKDDIQNYKGVAWNLDKILTVSEFHKNQLQETINLDDSLVSVTRNGIDLEIVNQAKDKVTDPRDYKKIMYSARPERGLDVLLEKIFPRILEQDPNAWLCLTGYDNQADQLQDLYNYIDNLSKYFGERVVWKPNLTKEDLYKEYLTAGCYLYPTPSHRMPDFREVSCITAMEAQACGLPIVTYAGGALPETIAHNAGTLIEDQPFDNPDAYAQGALEYIQGDSKFNHASQSGIFHSRSLDWDGVAREWDGLFENLISDRNDSPSRLVRHFIKRSDIQAAKYVDHKNGLGFDFSRWNYSLSDHYEECPNIDKHYEGVKRESRLENVKDLVPDSGLMLDFACGSGVYSIEIAKNKPNLSIVGVDISSKSIEKANYYLEQYGEGTEGRIEFSQGTEDDLATGQYDVAFVGEVLEHQFDPKTMLEKVEKSVKPGGSVVITVPYGPWEFGSNENHHLWEFDPHDLWDMLGDKPQLMIGYQNEGANPLTNDPVGYHVISYQADHEPIGAIDVERKINLQNPRETVSGCIMAGPGAEDSLRLHLNSYAHLMDELVVADTGLSREAKGIFEEYGAKFVEAPNPTIYGFETPRNTALQFCTMDWVWWIDTDENIVDSHNIPKYLKKNAYQGYGVHQHHFAIDTQFTPDMPVRLFRNKPRDGKKIRWYGMIHEHPELELNEGPGPVVIASDLNISHYGYLTEEIRQKRFWRNYPLLQKDIEVYPDRLLQKHFICRDSVLLAGYILNENGGVVTEEVEQFCRTAIETYQTYFLGKAGFVNVDSRSYYEQALRILGEGIECNVNIESGEGMRFASREDMEKVIGEQIDKILGDT